MRKNKNINYQCASIEGHAFWRNVHIVILRIMKVVSKFQTQRKLL